ncbi:NAC domain-containing protein 72-like [Papaver somniferum]|uniref:NAC domain-containing protein 72-like n=1 Tax=Papaver somniferum TaxID=3469 RepID=UPI000E7016AB|nr:NAC domain-containing protein 72-like [Papaver somniferum]
MSSPSGKTNPMLMGDDDDVENEAKLAKLPSGFKFQPTDEQLIVYYLVPKYEGEDPKDAHCSVGDEDTNFADKKVRVAGQGFWLLTGRSSLYSHNNSNSVIGYKHAWVYYEGLESEKHETDYVMHEYTLATRSGWNHSELDEWILCEIYKNEKMELIVDEETQFDNVEEDVETNFSDGEDEFDS